MKYLVIVLALLLFGCSIEKRIHRPGFHFKKSSTFQPSKKEKNTGMVNFKATSLTIEDSNIVSMPSQITSTQNKNQANIKYKIEKSTLNKANNFKTSLYTKEKKVISIQQNITDIEEPREKKRELYSDSKQPEEETRILVTTANVFAIMSFVFALLTIASVVMAFIMSWTLILPLLPALAAFFSGGLSLILGLPSKQAKYKSGFATIGLITSLIFFGFFIAILTGAILI